MNNRPFFLLTTVLATTLLMALCGPAGATTPSPPESGSHEQMPMEASASQHHHHPAPDDAGAEVGMEEHLGVRIPLDLTFRDETGKPVALRDLITTPTIIAPVYYHCPNVCSFLQGALAKALPQVKLKAGKDFRVLSVSFDETETPEVAHRSKAIFMEAMGGKFPEEDWHFLTGDSANIHRLLDAVGYHFERQGEDFIHPVAMFVVTTDGEIVRYLHGTSVLPMDLTLALVEASEGRIGPTIRRVAQFCFSYDPAAKRYVFNIFRVSAAVVLLTAGCFLAFLILKGRKSPDRPR